MFTRMAPLTLSAAVLVPSLSTAAAQSEDVAIAGTRSAALLILLVLATGGFGGFVHGLLRPEPIQYRLVLPFRAISKNLGFVGDLLVGGAAGTAMFFVMESLFGLSASTLTGDLQAYLKFLALGVICGYMGSNLLDGLSLYLSKRLIKQQGELEESFHDLTNLRERLQASSLSRQYIQLGDAYRSWHEWEKAIAEYDRAIQVDPGNPDNYVHKSLVFAAQAEQEKNPGLFQDAIKLLDRALEIDKNCARALYDRACFVSRMDPSRVTEISHDLGVALKLTPTLRELAALDPDLEPLRQSGHLSKLLRMDSAVDKTAAVETSTKQGHQPASTGTPA